MPWSKSRPDYKELISEMGKKYRAKNKKQCVLATQKCRLRKMGATVAQYEEFRKVQNGLCAICGLEQANQILSADHCHETTRVRGLLCRKCNTGLGMFQDSPELVNRAAMYLEKSFYAV